VSAAALRRVQVGDLDMAVVIEGAGPDLVLLHGGGDGADGMAALQARLATTYRVTAPEQRGHGRTPDPGTMSFAEMAEDTIRLLDTLGIDGADIVGWSDGGILALLIARQRPDLVRRVVAIGASVAMDSEPAPLSPADVEWIRTVDPAEVEMPIPVETRRRLLAMWLEGPALRLDDLAHVAPPVLVVAADRDMITLDHTVAIFRSLPAAQLAIIPGVGHDVPRTDPDLVATVIERFLAS